MSNQPNLESAPVAPDDDWIEWSGGECPVDPDAELDLRTRDGRFFGPALAWLQDWSHSGYSFDIIAYRLVRK